MTLATFESYGIGADVASAAAWDAASVAGAAPAVAGSPGLDGSTRCAVITAAGNKFNAVYPLTADVVTVYTTFSAADPPSGAGTGSFLEAQNAADPFTRGLVFLKAVGSIKVEALTGVAVGEFVHDFTAGVEYRVQWRIDRVGLTQTLWITDDTGGYWTTGPVDLGEDVDQVRVGVTDSCAMTIKHDNVSVVQTDDPAPVAPIALTVGIVGHRGSSDAITVSVQTQDCSQVRVRATDVATDQVHIGDPTLVTDYEITQTSVGGLEPFTQYELQVQTLAGGNWDPIGPSHFGWTLPAEDQLVDEIRIALTGCEADSMEFDEAWDDILAWGAHGWGQLGDWVYLNSLVQQTAPRRLALMQKLVNHPKMGDVARQVLLWFYTQSDHDRTNNSTQAHPCVPFAIQAQAETVPGPPFEVFESMEATCWSLKIAGDLWIIVDSRTNEVEEGLNSGGPSTARLWGTEQKAWIVAQMRRTDCTFRYLVSEKPMVGTAEGVATKADHGACHPVERDEIGAVMVEMDALLGRTAGLVIGADYHGLGCWQANRHAYWPWPGIVGCGTSNDSGNGRDPEEYDATYRFQGDPGEGDDIACYWRMTIATVDGVRTVTLTGWDALTGDIAAAGLEVVLGGPAQNQPAPRQLAVALSADGVAITNGSGWRRQLELRDRALCGLTYVDESEVIEGKHGAEERRGWYRPGEWAIPVVLTADSHVQLLDRRRELQRMMLGSVELEAIYPDGAILRTHVVGTLVEPVEEVDNGILFLCWVTQREPWRSKAQVTHSEQVAQGQTVRLDEFEGATFPLTDLTLEMRGPWRDAEIYPHNRGANMVPVHKFTYESDLEPLSPGTRVLVVDTATGKLVGRDQAGVVSWFPDYLGVSTPGSPYTLEVPPAPGGVPELKVQGTEMAGTTTLTVTGYIKYVSL